jgi:type IV pilus assembly protein PilQ
MSGIHLKSLIALTVAVAATTSARLAWAGDRNQIQAVVTSEQAGAAGTTTVRLRGSSTATFSVYRLDRPTRVVVDVSNAALTDAVRDPHERGMTWTPNTWAVSQVQASALDGDGAMVRLVVTLARPGRYDVKPDGKDLVVTVTPRDPRPAGASPADVAAARAEAEAARVGQAQAQAARQAAEAQAKQARSEADALRAAATTAQQDAERARVAAEQARAEVTRAQAEAARLQQQGQGAQRASGAERAKAQAQIDEARAIAARASKQAADAAAEAERTRAQATRASAQAEAARALAEQAQAAAREDRRVAVAERKGADAARVQAEAARADAARDRALATTAREQATQAQAEASAARAAAAADRVAAEAARKDAEAARQGAEQAHRQADKMMAEAKDKLARTDRDIAAARAAQQQAEATARAASEREAAARTAQDEAARVRAEAQTQAARARAAGQATTAEAKAERQRLEAEARAAEQRLRAAEDATRVALAQRKQAEAARTRADEATRRSEQVRTAAEEAAGRAQREVEQASQAVAAAEARRAAAEQGRASAEQAKVVAERAKAAAEHAATAARAQASSAEQAAATARAQATAAAAARAQEETAAAAARASARRAEELRAREEAAAKIASKTRTDSERAAAELARRMEAEASARATAQARTAAADAARRQAEQAEAGKVSAAELTRLRREAARLDDERARADQELQRRVAAVGKTQGELDKVEAARAAATSDLATLQAETAALRQTRAREEALLRDVAARRAREEAAARTAAADAKVAAAEAEAAKARRATAEAAAATEREHARRAEVEAETARTRRVAAEAAASAASARTAAATPAATAPVAAAPPAPRPRAPVAIRDVRFAEGGEAGPPEVTIDVGADARAELVAAGPGRVELVVDGADLPGTLERKLDVSRFGTAVRSVSSYRDRTTAGRVRVLVELATPATPRLERDGTTLRLKLGGATTASHARTRTQSLPPPVVGGFGATSAPITQKSIAQVMPGRKKVYRGPTLDLNFKEAPIHDLLRLLADVGKVNIVVPDDIQANVTVRMKQVPWDLALDVILASKGLWYRKEGRLYRVAPRKQLDTEDEAEAARRKAMVEAEAPEPEVMTLNYASSEELKSKLEPMLSPKGKIEVDPRTNSLIVNDVLAHRRRISALALQLDTQTPQISIEARIVEARSTFSREFGIQWGGRASASADGGNATGLIFPSSIGVAGGADDGDTNNTGTATPSDFAVNLPAAVGSGAGGALGLALGSVGGNFNINLRLSALEDSGTVRIISAPKITVLNNSEALINQGVSIPISVVSASGTQTQFVPADLSLTVKPYVSQRDCSIAMDLQVSKNEPDFVNTGARGDPTILRKEARTRILVADGETTVMGGIYTRNSGLNYSKVPFLGDLPVIGWFFKNRRESDSRTELLIFVTPKITNKAFLRCQ